jgi:membrane protease subunit HflK
MSQPHDHDHDHGPGGHTHGPGEAHDHDHGPARPPTSDVAVAAAAEAAPAPVSIEDAGSRALDEALRSSFVLVKILMVALVAVFVCSGMFIVDQNEVAVVLRFGQPVGKGEDQLNGPGWHWAWPYPIDEVVRIPRHQVHAVRSTVGWYAVTPEQEKLGKEPDMTGSLNPASDGYALTGDANIMHARATIRYRISDPAAYVFNFTSASNLVENAVNEALHAVAARFTVDGATRTNVAAYRAAVVRRTIELVARQNLGVDVDEANSTVETKVPRQVGDAFKEVSNAELDRSKQINDAQGKASEMVSKAKGEASEIESKARGVASKLVAAARADADSFTQQLPLYQANPKLFRERRFTEMMSRALTNKLDLFLLSDDPDKKRELRLLLNSEPQKPSAGVPGQPQ